MLNATVLPVHRFNAGVTRYFTIPGPEVEFTRGSVIVLPDPVVEKPVTDPAGRQDAVQLNVALPGVDVNATDQGLPEHKLSAVVTFETAGTGLTSAVIGVLAILLQLPVTVSASA